MARLCYMLVWGGVGTCMDADLPFLLVTWATTLTPKSTTKDDALELNHAPVAGNTLHMCTNVSSSSLYTIHNC